MPFRVPNLVIVIVVFAPSRWALLSHGGFSSEEEESKSKGTSFPEVVGGMDDERCVPCELLTQMITCEPCRERHVETEAAKSNLAGSHDDDVMT